MYLLKAVRIVLWNSSYSFTYVWIVHVAATRANTHMHIKLCAHKQLCTRYMSSQFVTASRCVSRSNLGQNPGKRVTYLVSWQCTKDRVGTGIYANSRRLIKTNQIFRSREIDGIDRINVQPLYVRAKKKSSNMSISLWPFPLTEGILGMNRLSVKCFY